MRVQSWSLLEIRKKESEHRLPRVCSYRYLGIDLCVMEHGMCTLRK